MLSKLLDPDPYLNQSGSANLNLLDLDPVLDMYSLFNFEKGQHNSCGIHSESRFFFFETAGSGSIP
jgi:hypothetical protein